MAESSEGLAPDGAPETDPDPTIKLRRVENPGTASEASFPAAEGATVVRFDADGFADVTLEDWYWIEPHATAQGIYRVEA